MKAAPPPSPSSSEASSFSYPVWDPTPSAVMEEEPPSEARDRSCYYPGCRKDANCSCEMCLASINATLDLMPDSSLTKLSAFRPRSQKSTPLSINSSMMSTPTSFTRTNPRKLESPALESTAKVPLCKKKEKKVKREWRPVRWILWSVFVLAVDFGASRWVSVTFRPRLSADLVRYMGEKSRVEASLNERLRTVQMSLQALLGDKVSNCSDVNSFWRISQDGLLVNSQCSLYKSSLEEVSIWGWPLQTGGLLASAFSSRSFTIITGRVREWSGGKMVHEAQNTECSWELRKWNATIVQLDPNTLILEYRRSSILENHGIFSAISELLRHHISGLVQGMKHKFWNAAAPGGGLMVNLAPT
ncbi:hypothetical protein SAY86_025595 [Trapa natans]|uniref:C-8 sterol isomerase n=1 Tax=Trapa natans TaxID=22666 RepID=A0AAN7MR87_TRANT|nr:hypothetical protein SAY86_025595 [Trapa natans]